MTATTRHTVTATLTEKELIFASLLAQERNAKAPGINRRFSYRQDYTINLIGVISELAFAKLAGIYPDTAFSYGDGGADFTYRGCKIDVKCSNTKRHPDLIVNTDTAIAGLYVIGYVFPEELRKVEFQGYMSGKAVKRAQIKDLGYGERYFVPNADLNPIAGLIQRMRK